MRLPLFPRTFNTSPQTRFGKYACLSVDLPTTSIELMECKSPNFESMFLRIWFIPLCSHRVAWKPPYCTHYAPITVHIDMSVPLFLSISYSNFMHFLSTYLFNCVLLTQLPDCCVSFQIVLFFARLHLIYCVCLMYVE